MEKEPIKLLQGQGDFGNYGHGLARAFMQEWAIKENTKASTEGLQGESEKRYEVGQNNLIASGGIMTVDSLRRLSGWQKEFKSSTLIKTIQSLEEFHQNLGERISLDNLEEVIKNSTTAYETLVERVSHYVERGRSWFAGVHLHREEEKAMMPAMSTLLIKLYSLGNVFQYLENLSYDYLMENQIESTALGDIINGKEALSVQGNMSSIGIQTGQIDKTAYQMKKRNGGGAAIDKRQELLQRTLPTLKGTDKESVAQYLAELQNIARMIDDLELQSSDDLEREDIKIDFIDISKMIYMLLKNPFLLSERETKEKAAGNYRDSDLALTMEYYQLTQGLAVKDALTLINQKRLETAETAAQDSIKTGGDLSQVLIDLKQKRVLRTGLSATGVEEQRALNNFNYDEAMSRLAEVTGLGSQAGARTTYYKDTQGKLQYGTNMDLAAGKEAKLAKISFGEKRADDVMKGGRHNIFGHSNEKELKWNAGFITSSFNMQILDYLAFHRDRKTNNFFIDMEAEDSTQAFTGIDNDNVFGKGVGSKKESRLVSYKEQAIRHGELKESEIREEDRSYKDSTTTLNGFKCIPAETAKQIRELDENKIEESMRPYLDRAARFALQRRILELKKYAASQSTVIDITTPEGMDLFKQETMKLAVQNIIDTAQTFTKDTNIRLHGAWGLRSAPSVLIRTLMGVFFGAHSGAKDKSYHQNDEYNTENMSWDEFYGAENRRNFNDKLWAVFDAMIEASGEKGDTVQQRRESVWRKMEKLSYLKDRPEEEKRIMKDMFIRGRTAMYGMWNLKDE